MLKVPPVLATPSSQSIPRVPLFGRPRVCGRATSSWGLIVLASSSRTQQIRRSTAANVEVRLTLEIIERFLIEHGRFYGCTACRAAAGFFCIACLVIPPIFFPLRGRIWVLGPRAPSVFCFCFLPPTYPLGSSGPHTDREIKNARPL